MAIAIKDDIDYEVNLKFIDDVRNELVDASHISSRSEDFSQYIVREDNDILLSFSNN